MKIRDCETRRKEKVVEKLCMRSKRAWSEKQSDSCPSPFSCDAESLFLSLLQTVLSLLLPFEVSLHLVLFPPPLKSESFHLVVTDCDSYFTWYIQKGRRYTNVWNSKRSETKDTGKIKGKREKERNSQNWLKTTKMNKFLYNSFIWCECIHFISVPDFVLLHWQTRNTCVIAFEDRFVVFLLQYMKHSIFHVIIPDAVRGYYCVFACESKIC